MSIYTYIEQNRKAAKAAYIKASAAYIAEDYKDARLECDKANNYHHNDKELSKDVGDLSECIDKDAQASYYYDEAKKAHKVGNISRALFNLRKASEYQPSSKYLRERIDSFLQELNDTSAHQNPVVSNLRIIVLALIGLSILAIVIIFFVQGSVMSRIISSIPTHVSPPATVPVKTSTAVPGSSAAIASATPQETDTPTPLPTSTLTPTPTPTPTPTQPLPFRNGIVLTDGVRLREGAGTNYGILSPRFLSMGAEVEVLDGPFNERTPATYTPKEPNARCNGRQWFRVRWYNAQQGSELKGWICSDFLYVEGETVGPNR